MAKHYTPPSFIVSELNHTELPDRHYVARLPRPMRAADLELIAERFYLRFTAKRSDTLHLIGIANSGVPLSTAIGLMNAHPVPRPTCFLSVLNLDRDNAIDTTEINGLSNTTHILIDNSAMTGRTVMAALDLLRKEHGILPRFVVKLVEYHDDQEKELAAFLEAVYDTKLISLYTFREIRASVHARQRNPLVDTAG